jgi:hypothetical protein
MSDCLRRVVAVSGETQQTRFLEALLLGANGYGSVAVESVAGAYPCIKRERPDLIIVYLAIEDAAMCQLLSLLALDPETSTIPVQTWAERYDDGRFERLIVGARHDCSTHATAMPAN